MREYGFSVVLEKTEVVVLTKERVPTVFPIQVGETMVLLKPELKNLGIMVDTKNFFEEIRYTADKAAAIMFAICRII